MSRKTFREATAGSRIAAAWIGAFGSMLCAMTLVIGCDEQRSEPDPVESQVRNLLRERTFLESSWRFSTKIFDHPLRAAT